MKGQAASPEVLGMLSGPFVANYTAERRELVGVTTTGYGRLAYVKPAPGQTFEGAEVALSVCADGSQETATRDGRTLGPLAIVQATFYLARVDGELKIWWRSGKKVVSC